MKLRYALIPFGILVTICLIGILALWLFIVPSSQSDNADTKERPEMIRCTLAWGRLSSFPETAKNFEIHTIGGSFTRAFQGSFSDTPENIQKWLQSSPGVTDGVKIEGVTDGEKIEDEIILKTGEGASHGEIILSPNGSHVVFQVSWS